jgi:hypothetical protein
MRQRNGTRSYGLGRVAAGAFAVALATSALLAPTASAAGQGHGTTAARIEVLTPRDGARTSAKTLEVRVKVSSSAGFFAQVAGHDVSRRFHRHGGVLEATLRRGRDFDLGADHLLLATVRGAAPPAR